MRTLREVADAVRAGELKAVEVLDECLDAIDRHNPALNAFVHLDPDLARAAAEAVDAKVAAGHDPGPLAGVPFGVKDLEDCAGMPTSHGSLLFKGRPPVQEDSIHVGRLRAAGAVPVGKTAAPEFGAIALTDTKAWGTTRNPWDLSKTPGGSSGGSAAAVSAGLVPFCTASDGGGSTRIPAGFTGLVGFKPSFGRIAKPHFGASQTSVTGCLTTTVADAARHLDVAAGPDDRDRTSLPPSGTKYEQAIETLDVAGFTATWSSDLGFAECDREVAEIAFAAAEALIDAAALALIERPIAMTDPMRMWLSAGAADLWMDIEKGMFPERSDDLTAVPYFGLTNTKDVVVPQYARILMRRWRFDDEVAAIFRDVDLLLTPTTAVPAYPAEGPMTTEINGVAVAPGMAVPFTQLGNLGWNPGISLPAGVTRAGLPVGLMITARRHADDVVLRLARIFEQARPWPRLAPGYS